MNDEPGDLLQQDRAKKKRVFLIVVGVALVAIGVLVAVELSSHFKEKQQREDAIAAAEEQINALEERDRATNYEGYVKGLVALAAKHEDPVSKKAAVKILGEYRDIAFGLTQDREKESCARADILEKHFDIAEVDPRLATIIESCEKWRKLERASQLNEAAMKANEEALEDGSIGAMQRTLQLNREAKEAMREALE